MKKCWHQYLRRLWKPWGHRLFKERTSNTEKKKNSKTLLLQQIPDFMYGCLNIHPNVKDMGSRGMLPCIVSFTFDLIAHANILIHFSTAGEAVFTASVSADSQEIWSSITFSSEVRKTDSRISVNTQLLGCHAAIWQNMLLLQRVARSSTFTATRWRGPWYLEKKRCNHKGAIKPQSREKPPIKYRETEVLMIYCGRGIISEEREGTAEVKVRNVSESEDGEDLLSGPQRAGG